MTLSSDLINELKTNIIGEVCSDFVTRMLYSTDASIYQIEPLGVVFPRTLDDISKVMAFTAKYDIAVIARGAGSSLAGQAIGPGLVIDTSRYLTEIISINQEEKTAVVEPGVLLTAFNRASGKQGLKFGPDPASSDRATVGGSVANNATGAHSIMYGMSSDQLRSVDVVLSDGSETTFEEITLDRARQIASNGNGSVEAAMYRAALEIRDQHGDAIKASWPKVWRRASGYNLNYLLPWSPVKPDSWAVANEGSYPPIKEGTINLAPLIAGSEGTLAVIKRVRLNLVPVLKTTILGVLRYSSIPEACDAVPGLLDKFMPSALELMPGELIDLARKVPAYAKMLSWVEGTPPAMLAIEFAGEDMETLRKRVKSLPGDLMVVAETKADQTRVWNLRKMGLGILNSLPGDAKPYGFVEDVAVPVEKLGDFVRGMAQITTDHDTHAYYYAHASAGCLHIRPVISLKGAENNKRLRSIAEAVVGLALALNGAITGEHGDGRARSEWMARAYGDEVYGLFKSFKGAADPKNLLNPGNIVDAPPMNENLRYGENYAAGQTWETVFDFSSQVGLDGAIEMCNGAGVCRKDTGLMCPSYQVTLDEKESTRGRANLLRAMISGGFPSQEMAEKVVYEALDLCLACKGCKSECPSRVDMAKLKYEFLFHYYQKHPRRLRDHLFANIDWLAPLANPVAGIANPIMASMPVRKLFEMTLGLASERIFPEFAPQCEKSKINAWGAVANPDVLFLNDSFSRDFHPETALAGLQAVEAAGCKVRVLPVVGAGRPLISKGFLDRAKEHAAKLVAAIKRIDPEGHLPIVGVEPSEIFSLRDEYVDFFPEDAYVQAMAKRAWMADEFMLRPASDGVTYLDHLKKNTGADKSGQRVLLHGQCYQKVQPMADDALPTGAQASLAMLKAMGYEVSMVETGCCGMAGAFGYEAEHYEVSMQLGEMSLFPAVRETDAATIVAASGTSCRSQIKSGTQRKSVHPISLLL